ncbi:hypothetical protein F4819DRAFT_52236 [Hypoxylon fuscum]|nr:hypothetical protein F4819DRAFT_52236 [Hypoxylon fuscum]
MAPHKGQSKPGKAVPGHAKKQPATITASSRPVIIPAIPLPMMPKQASKANRQAPNVSSANGFPASSLEAALADHAEHVSVSVPDGAKALQAAKTSENEADGTNVEKTEHAATTNGAHSGDNNERVADAPPPVNGTNGLNGANVTGGQQTCSTPSSVVDAELAVVSPAASANETSQGARDAAHNVSQLQSATSPTRPDLQQPPHFQPPPPPTHPLQNQLSTDQLPDATNLRGPPLTHHYQDQDQDHRQRQRQRQHQNQHPHPHPHQHHPYPRINNGVGVVFGGFPGSHTPSPVPPPAGFYPPPPPLVNGDGHIHPRPNGQHHAQSNGNGGLPGPINTQFRHDMLPVSSIDTYGQAPATVPQPSFDPFSPAGRYGLSTPHSFHDSHTSGEPNGAENGPMPPPYPPSGMPYDGHARNDHSVGHPGPPNFPPFMPPQPFSRPLGIFDDGLREHIRYFQDQFDNGELNDCVLELISTKGSHHPIKITGHKFIFARSPALKQHIMAARATDLGSHTITIESDDMYLRSDAWWSAVRCLYLHPLLNPVLMDDTAASGLQFDGGKVDRFQFCLGYASAGHLLHMHDVFMRGLHMAAELVTWDTVEEALGFVFEGTTQRHINYDNEQSIELDFGYGPEVSLLLDAVMNFLINAFPPNFELDPSVTDPLQFARVPAAALMLSPATDAPRGIARGTNMRKSKRLSNIKFGDLPAAYPEDGAIPQRGPAKCSPTLSRILLNLPFYELRAVLTSESDGVSGWNTAQDRYHAVAEVVAEREARRLRAVDAVRAGTVPHVHMIRQRLSAQRRHAIVEPWDVLNWQEEIVQPRGAEVPQIVRTWVPQFSVKSEAAQPHSQPYDAHNSMV